MEFPLQLIPDESTRAGRMLAAGDVRVTVTSLESGEHITVRFKAILDNRDRIMDVDKNWVRVPLAEATHVFVEVPNQSGEWADKIGTFYPKNGRFFKDTHADPARVWAAQAAARWFLFPEGSHAGELKQARFQEEERCGVCGRELTDPVSIDRGIGPECYGKQTGSQHQVRSTSRSTDSNTANDAAEARASACIDHAGEPRDSRVQAVLSSILALPDEHQDEVYNEMTMWRSQERQSTLFEGR